MIKNNLFKGMCLLWLLLAATPVLQAQDRMQQASELLDRLIAGKGDSVYVHLDDNIRKMLSVEMLNGLFKQLEQQVGKYQSHGEWKNEQINGMTIYYCDAKFERIPLRFLTAFNPDGKVNTIRFVPVPATNATPPTASVQDKIKETDIQICTGSFKLPGTLTLPKNGKNLPVVILVHGSGPNDRDETVGVNKPFRDLAYGLAERGIAVIRYDKRTKVYGADSAPAGKEITFDEESVDDALSAVKLAESIPTIDPGRIYILGHSLGGTLAPRIAQCSDKTPAGIILLAGAARPLEDLFISQVKYLAPALPSTNDIQKDIAQLQKQVDNVKKLDTDTFDITIPLPMNLPHAYWAFANQYKPLEVVRKLALPILVLQGERDYQVTMHDFDLWHTALAGNPKAMFKTYPRLNHLFQEGEGKSVPLEYSRPAPIPAYVMDDIAAFINHPPKR